VIFGVGRVGGGKSVEEEDGGEGDEVVGWWGIGYGLCGMYGGGGE